MSDRYDTLAPEVLRIVSDIVKACNEVGVEVGFCGEMARKPIEAMALVGVGMRSFSMPPSAVGPVKAMLRSIEVKELVPFVERIVQSYEPTVRRQLEEYAKEHGVVI